MNYVCVYFWVVWDFIVFGIEGEDVKNIIMGGWIRGGCRRVGRGIFRMMMVFGFDFFDVMFMIFNGDCGDCGCYDNEVD